MNINLDNYKYYKNIEIEMKLSDKIENKRFFWFDNFAFLFNFCKIYNKKGEQLTSNYFKEKAENEKFKIIINKDLSICEEIFRQNSATEIKINKYLNIYNNNIINAKDMFYMCFYLIELDLSTFNTENVTDMSHMFGGCLHLKKLKISNFNTKNVKNMRAMFSDCGSLTELDLSNFNTSKVTDMSYMFSGCDELKIINLSSFNTENVIDMGGMFFNCTALEELDLSNFGTEKLEYTYDMFFGCKSLKKLIFNYKKDKIKSDSDMFRDCSINLNK